MAGRCWQREQEYEPLESRPGSRVSQFAVKLLVVAAVFVLTSLASESSVKETKKEPIEEENMKEIGWAENVKEVGWAENNMELCDDRNRCCNCSDEDKIQNLQPKFGYDHPPSCDLVHRSVLSSERCNQTSNRDLELYVTCTGRSGSAFLVGMMTKAGLDVVHDEERPRGLGAVTWQQAFSNQKFTYVEKKTKKKKERRCNYPNKQADWKRGVYFRHIFHLVRAPLGAIESRWNRGKVSMGRGYLDTTRCNCDIFETHPLSKITPIVFTTETSSINLGYFKTQMLIATLRHWVLWNMFAQQTSSWGFPLERMDKDDEITKFFSQLQERIDLKKKPSDHQLVQVQRLEGQKKNSKHTMKYDGFKLSWGVLYDSDPVFSVMAQLMAIRYGYEITVQELLPPLKKHFCYSSAEGGLFCAIEGKIPQPECFFDRMNEERWTCNLPQQLKKLL